MMNVRQTAMLAVALVFLSSCKAGQETPRTQDPSTETDTPPAAGVVTLQGPPDDPANDHIPDIPFPAPDPADSLIVNDTLAISFRELLLVFEDTTTVQQANELLTGINASITGGIPAGSLLGATGGGILLLNVRATNLNALMALVTMLHSDPRVQTALMEMGGTQDALPPHNEHPARSRASAATGPSPLWSWEVPAYPNGPTDFEFGNWGLELIRAPQVWNLDDFVLKNLENNVTRQVSAGVVDGEFDLLHPDLGKLELVDANVPLGDHGTFIAGIIGANWQNNEGVEGINPWLDRIYAKKIDNTLNRSYFGRILDAIIRLLIFDRSIRAVNVSVGIPLSQRAASTEFGDRNGNDDHTDAGDWAGVDFNRDGALDTWAQVMDRYGELYHSQLGGYRDAFFVSSAGNVEPGMSGPRPRAVHTSPLNNAAVRFRGPFLTVEGMEFDNSPAVDSFGGGSVSAPGENIESTEKEGGYGSKSGTSFAAPHVTGLITVVWTLAPELSIEQVRELITDQARTVELVEAGSAPRIDAFAAVMGIDILRNNKTLQEALVDVDDGTADGNLRVNPFTGEVFMPGLVRRGDGTINMRDFRVFRDAYLQAMDEERLLDPPDFSLDGPTDHEKRDLNLDGCVAANCPFHLKENIFPRYDFNGDGRIAQWFVTAPFKEDPDGSSSQNTTSSLQPPPGNLRDIDVLADPELWKLDREQVSVTESDEGVVGTGMDQWQPKRYLLQKNDPSTGTFDYLRSADLHFFFAPPPTGGIEEIQIHVGSELPAGVHVNNGDCGSQIEFDNAWRRCITLTPPSPAGDGIELILTVPLWSGKVGVLVQTIDEVPPFASRYPVFFRNVDNPLVLKQGEDFAISMEATVEAPAPRPSLRVPLGQRWSTVVEFTLRIQNVGRLASSAGTGRFEVGPFGATERLEVGRFDVPPVSPGGEVGVDVLIEIPDSFAEEHSGTAVQLQTRIDGDLLFGGTITVLIL